MTTTNVKITKRPITPPSWGRPDVRERLEEEAKVRKPQPKLPSRG